ncbi:MAG: hypothetical protein LC135_06895 [Phycisphaerae bacterium]|jgi:hypothetical protein|nr:hypothetical protein [Phycisphaerae bacterium]MCZ2399583.1 hypothetical protein [Phycisphaerae bacterium]NUQ50077.1 hypothetical protein [Phycisphaerae bacterium]
MHAIRKPVAVVTLSALLLGSGFLAVAALRGDDPKGAEPFVSRGKLLRVDGVGHALCTVIVGQPLGDPRNGNRSVRPVTLVATLELDAVPGYPLTMPRQWLVAPESPERLDSGWAGKCPSENVEKPTRADFVWLNATAVPAGDKTRGQVETLEDILIEVHLGEKK